MSVKFEDNHIQVNEAIKAAALAFLNEAAGEVRSQAMQNAVVDTGRTKNSYDYYTDDGEMTAYVGGNYENIIWEEYGTGEFALHGDGRKTPWRYRDRHGNWHTTRGKRPRQPLLKAFKSKAALIKRVCEQKFRGLNNA